MSKRKTHPPASSLGVNVKISHQGEIMIDEVGSTDYAATLASDGARAYAKQIGGSVREGSYICTHNKTHEQRPLWDVLKADGTYAARLYWWYPWDAPWDMQWPPY